MPVVFQAPDPFSSKISSEYGATQEFNQTLPTLAGLAESRNRLNLQAGQAAIQQATQAQAQTARNREQAYEEQDRTDAGFELQRRAQAQQLEVQAREQAYHAAMQDRQLTYADQIKNTERQNALAAIQAAVTRGDITPEEAGYDALKIQTGIDVYEQKYKKQQAEHQKAIADMEVENVARQKRAQLGADALSAKTMPDRIVHTKGPNGEDISLFQKGVDANGNPTYDIIPNSKMETEAKKAEIVQKHLETEWKRYDTLDKAYEDAFSKREAEVRKIHEGRRKLEPGKPGYEAEEPDGAQIDKEVRNDLNRREIYKPTAPKGMAGGSASVGNPSADQTANTPAQDAQVQNDQRGEQPPAASIGQQINETAALINSSPKLTATGKATANESLRKFQALLAKPNPTADDIQEMKNLRNHITGLLK